MSRVPLAVGECASFSVVLNVTVHHGDDLWELREQALQQICSQLDPLLLDIMYLPAPREGDSSVAVVTVDDSWPAKIDDEAAARLAALPDGSMTIRGFVDVDNKMIYGTSDEETPDVE